MVREEFTIYKTTDTAAGPIEVYTCNCFFISLLTLTRTISCNTINWALMKTWTFLIFLWKASKHWTRLTNTLAKRLRELETQLLGGGIINWCILNSPWWCLTISAFRVSGSLQFCTFGTYIALAISTAIERVFSQGRQVLYFTWNWLSPASIRSLLCFGDWSHKDLVSMPAIIEAIKGHGKQKNKRVIEEISTEEE